MKLDQKKKVGLLVGFLTIAIFAIGATYAYFTVTVTNNATASTVTGTAKKYGVVTLTQNTSSLKATLGAEMSQSNATKVYYATTSGTVQTTNPNAILATAQLTNGEVNLTCNYSFTVTSSVTTAISDGSDSNVVIKIGNVSKTLKDLTTAGSTGIAFTGTLTLNPSSGTASATIPVESTITNTNSTQNGLMGNTYTISIAKPSFTCNPS